MRDILNKINSDKEPSQIKLPLVNNYNSKTPTQLPKNERNPKIKPINIYISDINYILYIMIKRLPNNILKIVRIADNDS